MFKKLVGKFIAWGNRELKKAIIKLELLKSNGGSVVKIEKLEIQIIQMRTHLDRLEELYAEM